MLQPRNIAITPNIKDQRQHNWCYCSLSPIIGVGVNMVVRSFASSASAAFCAFLFVTFCAGAGDRAHNRYPNELSGFKFYSKYLAPLRPGVSNEDAVRRVLGTEPAKRNGWAIFTTYSMKGGPVYNPTLGPLSQIIIRPDSVIPMSAVHFSPSFEHCHWSVSEINISFATFIATVLAWSTGYTKRIPNGGKKATCTASCMGHAGNPFLRIRSVSCCKIAITPAISS